MKTLKEILLETSARNYDNFSRIHGDIVKIRNLNPDEEDAFWRYTEDSASDINKAFKGEKYDHSAPDLVKKYVKLFPGIIKSHKTVEPFTVYRGLDRNIDHSKNIGKIIRMKGLHSTTRNYRRAMSFANGTYLNRVHFEPTIYKIHVPVGVHAFDSVQANHGADPYREHEVILPHNAKFHIHKIEKKTGKVQRSMMANPEKRWEPFNYNLIHMTYKGV